MSHDHDADDFQPIPLHDVRDVLAEMGVDVTPEQAAELARLLDLTGSVEGALAALISASGKQAA